MKTIKMLGALFIVIGFLQLIFRAKSIWWSFQSLFRPGSFVSTEDYILLGLTSVFFLFLLPLATLIAGNGLIRFKKHGWILALSVCGITFLTSFYGTINFVIESSKYKNIPMPEIPEGAHIEIVSVWPTYIYLAVSALLILILTRRSLRKELNT